MNLPEWPEMFGVGSEARRFRIVTKRGTPLLLLPLQSNIAARTLELYPAQTLLARSFRTLLAFTLRAHLPTPATRVELPFSSNAPIPAFIRECAGGDRDFGILLGNANAPGRRWILMIFDPDGQPWRIVKAGVSPRARNLIRAESSILGKLPTNGGFFPKLHNQHESDVSAICMEYVPGQSPRSPELISATLSPWLNSGERRTIGGFTQWQHVRKSDAPQQTISMIEEALRSTPLRTTLAHGDFAPWNIREHNGKWTVLDWERGEEFGIPGWDWFHYIVQTEVLVRRRSPQDVLKAVMQTIALPDFQNYAAQAEFTGKEMPLLAGYLHHAVYVNRQTEGADALKQMLAIVSV